MAHLNGGHRHSNIWVFEACRRLKLSTVPISIDLIVFIPMIHFFFGSTCTWLELETLFVVKFHRNCYIQFVGDGVAWFVCSICGVRKISTIELLIIEINIELCCNSVDLARIGWNMRKFWHSESGREDRVQLCCSYHEIHYERRQIGQSWMNNSMFCFMHSKTTIATQISN